MQKFAVVLLAAFAAQACAERVRIQKVVGTEAEQAVAGGEKGKVQIHKVAAAKAAAVEQAVAGDEDDQAVHESRAKELRDADKDPKSPTAGMPYWYQAQGQWEFVAPELTKDSYGNTIPHIMQFELKEDKRIMQTTKYDVKLQEYEDVNTHVEVRRKIDAKVLRVENYFWTMHNHQSAVFKSEQGTQIGEYLMFKPHVFNRRYSWRVTKMSDPDTVLFTIQKRLYDDHCKYLNLFSCRPVVKIYVGHKGDKSTLIYYGVGDKDLDEPDFKFWHSEGEYKNTKHNWAAKIDHKKTKDKKFQGEEDKYKVKVKPGEDAGLILLATVCLDEVGDDARAAEPEDHDD